MSFWDHIVAFFRRLFGLAPRVDEPDAPEEPIEEPEEPVEPTPEPFAAVLWPDEFVIGDSWAVRGRYVEAVAPGDGDELETVTLTVPSGSYEVTARVYAPGLGSDAFYLGVDGEARRLWPPTVEAWSLTGLMNVPLDAGTHTFSLGTAEVGVLVDAIAVTSTDWSGSLDELLGEPPKIEAPEQPLDPEPQPEPEPEPDPELPTVPAPGPEWARVFHQTFERDASESEFLTTYPALAAYPDGWPDTSQRGRYSTSITSAEGGAAVIRMRTIDGQPRVCALQPRINSDPFKGQLHGRYQITLRVDAPAAGYKIVPLLWPDSDRHEEGELNWPEADLTPGAVAHGFSHQVGPTPHINEHHVTSQASVYGWHTYTLEWTPARVRWLLDGQIVSETTKPRAIPTTPMHWVIQFETAIGGNAPSPETVATVRIRDVTVWELAPVVVVPEPPEPPETDTWPLTVRAFDGTYRNGKAMSAEERRAYDAILNYWRTTGKADAVKALRGGNSYAIGRGAPASALGSLDILLRLTGDARLLDLLAELGLEAIKGMRRTWAPGTNLPTQYARAPHGELFLPWLKTQSEERYYGADAHFSDTPKAWSVLARVAHALTENRHATSPAGHDYNTLADQWRDLFAGYEKVWSAVNDDAFPAAAKVPQTYKGRWVAGTFRRAAKDDWPTNMRTTTHTNWSCAILTLLMGRILGKSDQQSMTGIDGYVRDFMNHEQGTPDQDTGFGPGVFFARGTVSWSGSENYECPLNYGEMVTPDAVMIKLMLGERGHVTSDFLTRYARNIAGWVLKGTPASFTARNGVAGMATRTYTTPDGKTRTLPDASNSGTSGAGDRTDDQYAGYGLQLLQAWDVPSGKLAEYGRAAWLRYSGASGGSIDRPIDLYYPTGLLLRGALA